VNPRVVSGVDVWVCPRTPIADSAILVARRIELLRMQTPGKSSFFTLYISLLTINKDKIHLAEITFHQTFSMMAFFFCVFSPFTECQRSVS